MFNSDNHLPQMVGTLFVYKQICFYSFVGNQLCLYFRSYYLISKTHYKTKAGAKLCGRETYSSCPHYSFTLIDFQSVISLPYHYLRVYITRREGGGWIKKLLTLISLGCCSILDNSQ